MPFYGLFEASYIGKVSFCAYQSNLLGEYTSEAEVPELTYDKKPALTTGPSGSVTESSAIVTCEYRYTAFWSEKIGVEFSDGAGNRHEMVQDVTEDGTYSFQLTGLQPETTYTYRAFAIIDGKHFYADNPKSFVTSKGIDVKDIEFEITPTFKESAPSTEEGPRYLKFWYEVSTNDIKKYKGCPDGEPYFTKMGYLMTPIPPQRMIGALMCSVVTNQTLASTTALIRRWRIKQPMQ